MTTFGKTIADAALRVKQIEEQIAALSRTTVGYSADGAVRKRRALETQLRDAQETYRGTMQAFVAEVDEHRARAAEIARWSQPTMVERMLAGTKHAEAARQRRLRYLAEAKARVGATGDPKISAKEISDDADLVDELKRILADVLVLDDGDDNRTGALIERLRQVVSYVETLSETGKALSPLAPKAALANRIEVELGRALGLAKKIRSARSE